MINSLSVILPTLNEEQNLKTLIPSIQNVLDNDTIKNYEILVIDDGSTDDSESLLKKFDNNIKFYKRIEKKSLPMSISDGVKLSKYENVMWLDADGSMNAEAVKKLLKTFSQNVDSVVVGSRFVENGGYKGIEVSGETSFLKAMYNVWKSNDSILATILSKVFNNILYIILPGKVKDLTSGFIVLNKKLIKSEVFSISNYGDYFLYLINDLVKNNVNIIEVGYLCDTRIHGESKTGSSIFQLINRGLPYITAAVRCRMGNNENIS
jgi:glycosyltransferase involved in cell wall biosynthesis